MNCFCRRSSSAVHTHAHTHAPDLGIPGDLVDVVVVGSAVAAISVTSTSAISVTAISAISGVSVSVAGVHSDRGSGDSVVSSGACKVGQGEVKLRSAEVEVN